MDDAKWERYGLLAGIVFVVLLVVSTLIGGSPPKPSDHDPKIINYFKDNQDALKIGSYLGGLALLFFLWFLGSLFGRLRRAEAGTSRVSGIALTGGVVAVGIAMIASGVSAYAALHPDLSAPGNFRLSTVMFGYGGFALAVLVGATAVVVLRSNVLPSWFGVASAAVALVWLIASAAVSTEDDAVNTIGFIAFLAWAVWIVVVVALLYRAPEPATTRSAA